MSAPEHARDNVPEDNEAAAAVLARADVPSAVVAVAKTLQAAGHAAVLVGGAVRDALLEIPVSDWDVATSATPDEVMGLFRRTIPTGVQHGTVTVLVKVADRAPSPVEVTTFRGEGEYTDGRRPERVEFLRDLVEDLARRDLTINAFAWDPIGGVFTDPFDGLADLRAGIVRAVGDPERRFCEDGLRTMRAVRFCATHDMRLEPATAAAIAPALPILDKVSRERVHVELFKLLGAPRPSQGLRPMVDTGIWPHVLPRPGDDALDEAIDAVDRMAPDPLARLARLLWPMRDASPTAVADAIDRLRPSRDERRIVLALCSDPVAALRDATDDVAIRRAVAALGRAHLHRALDLLDASPPRRAAIARACKNAPLAPSELAIKGGDLVTAGLVTKGPAVGELMQALLDDAIADPSSNTRDALLARARARTSSS